MDENIGHQSALTHWFSRRQSRLFRRGLRGARAGLPSRLEHRRRLEAALRVDERVAGRDHVRAVVIQLEAAEAAFRASEAGAPVQVRAAIIVLKPDVHRKQLITKCILLEKQRPVQSRPSGALFRARECEENRVPQIFY